MRPSNEDPAWTAAEPAAIAATLRDEGLDVDPAALELLPRDDRFAVRLPGARMGWFPVNLRGLRRMQRERRILDLIARHCAFAAPRVLIASEAGWDVRAMVEGEFDPFGVYHRVIAEPDFARTVGQGFGAVLAQLHTAIPRAALAGGWLPRRPAWPPPIAWTQKRLPKVTDDAGLIDRSLKLLGRYEAAERQVAQRVLAHTDLGFHNAVIDPQSGAVAGVFDFDGAAYCDPHHDFRYLLLDETDETLLEAAVAVYEAQTGVVLDHDRLRLLNAACAVAFLAYRAGSAPDAAPAGRTLAEDLRWTSMALARAGG
jgi:aminoglycoside phosphotransferase (APT) family kinase protein